MPRFIWFDPIPPGAVQTVTRSYRASYADTTSATTYTFTGCDIGTAVAGRVVVVAVETHTLDNKLNRTLSSGTIGGAAAGVRVTAGTTAYGTASIMSLVVAAGATATITVTMNGATDGCAIHVYALYGAASATPTDTASATDSSATTIDIPAGGVCIGCAYNRTQGVTWTLTSIVEDAHADFDVAAYCTGSVESLIAQTGASVRLLPSTILTTRQAFAAWG